MPNVLIVDDSASMRQMVAVTLKGAGYEVEEAVDEVRVKKLRTLHNNTVVEREQQYRNDLAQEPVSGDIELF